ncbi:MAG: SPASM domain-containing protein [Treponema sp.]|jgi:radical SAM protein with 4Fe4S-binding SPASM domain|nr:SPASM domain-containing protein [Treponema sp.]
MKIPHGFYVRIKKILKPFRAFIFKPPFTNDAFNKQIAEEHKVTPPFYPDSLEKYITRISFEISNMCNYTHIHKKCPVSRYTDKKKLETSIVYKVLDELALYNFCGEIDFHRYNEPMIDTRLFEFIEYTNKVLPNAKISILTNGSLLNQEVIEKFEKYKLWHIIVSSYTFKEHERLIKLKTTIPYKVYYSRLDDREDIYNRKEINSKLPCYATIRDITVNCYGDISICCLDWQNRFVFGNVSSLSLKEILNSKQFLEVHHELFHGKRTLGICKRCDWQR